MEFFEQIDKDTKDFFEKVEDMGFNLEKEQTKQEQIEKNVDYLEFVETTDGKTYGHFTILLQEYWEYADKDDDEGKPIYNVAIEFNEEPHDIFSYTLDIFESYDFEKTKEYYELICNNIEKINKPREIR